MKHGAPRTPTTQGLIERSNRTCKEDMHTLIVSTVTKVSNLIQMRSYKSLNDIPTIHVTITITNK